MFIDKWGYPMMGCSKRDSKLNGVEPGSSRQEKDDYTLETNYNQRFSETYQLNSNLNDCFNGESTFTEIK